MFAGGNAFCEVQSLGKLARMLPPDRLDPVTRADALTELARGPAPAAARATEVLSGLPRILAAVARWRATQPWAPSDRPSRP